MSSEIPRDCCECGGDSDFRLERLKQFGGDDVVMEDYVDCCRNDLRVVCKETPHHKNNMLLIVDTHSGQCYRKDNDALAGEDSVASVGMDDLGQLLCRDEWRSVLYG